MQNKFSGIAFHCHN